MTNLVGKMRDQAAKIDIRLSEQHYNPGGSNVASKLLKEAADEIERLRDVGFNSDLEKNHEIITLQAKVLDLMSEVERLEKKVTNARDIWKVAEAHNQELITRNTELLGYLEKVRLVDFPGPHELYKELHQHD